MNRLADDEEGGSGLGSSEMLVPVCVTIPLARSIVTFEYFDNSITTLNDTNIGGLTASLGMHGCAIQLELHFIVNYLAG
jgi:hypothetical protein